MINNNTTTMTTTTNNNTAVREIRPFGERNRYRMELVSEVPPTVYRKILKAIEDSTLLRVINSGGEGVYSVFIPFRNGDQPTLDSIISTLHSLFGGQDVWISEEVSPRRTYSRNSYLGYGVIVRINSNYRWDMLVCRNDTNKKGW